MTFTESPAGTGGPAAQDTEAGEGTARLRDGTEIRIRHVTRGDEAALLGFMQQLSAESRRLRFFTPAYDLESAARWAASADGTDHLGLVALGSEGEMLGHAACVRMYGPRAEVAVEINEARRHQGLATTLLTRLAREAARKHIRSFVAEVLPENHEMLAVFDDGFAASHHTVDGEVDIEFPTTAWSLPETRLTEPEPENQ